MRRASSRRWPTRALASLLVIFTLGVARHARAAPEEIQVYMDELDAPGQLGLDVHTNLVASGFDAREDPDQQASLHRLRVTPEWSLGLTRFLELGAYVPLTTLDREGHFRVDGVKGRLKFIAPRAEARRWFWGANLELGVVDHSLDPNPWNAELKGIAGAHLGRWTLAFNANLDFKVAGPAPSPASLDLDTKLGFELVPHLALGLESYNGAGPLRSPGDFGHSEQTAFAALDADLGAWGLNVGVGWGYGENADRLVLKAIVSVPID